VSALELRAARPGDEPAIFRVHEAAFGRRDEAELAEKLARREPGCVSLVACEAGEVIGHVLFSPVAVDGRRFPVSPMGLGPVGVLPGRQRSGAGIELCRAGIEACRRLGAPFLVVLGHTTYYPRFGFVPAVRFGLTFADAPPRDAFMALELVPGALSDAGGRVRYAPEFTPG
jgi:putative acetyltransferase